MIIINHLFLRYVQAQAQTGYPHHVPGRRSYDARRTARKRIPATPPVPARHRHAPAQKEGGAQRSHLDWISFSHLRYYR